MSTANEPDQNVDTVPQTKAEDEPVEEEEEDFSDRQEFMWYMKPKNVYELLQKRWVKFSLITAISYSYSFVMAVYGVDMYCHYSRFFSCEGTKETRKLMYEKGAYVPHSAATYNKDTAMYDTYLQVVIYHHILEWLRQWCLLTAIIVGYKWMIDIYYFVSIFSIPYGIIATFMGFIVGVTNSCGNHQTSRGSYLKLQGISFFLYLPFTLHPVYMFKICEKYLHPQDKDKQTNELLYESYLHALWNEEEEDDD